MIIGFNKSADPCKNFTNYACGNWGQLIHHEHETYEMFRQKMYVLKYIENAVNDVTKNGSSPIFKKFVKSFYDDCNYQANYFKTNQTTFMHKLFRKLVKLIGMPPAVSGADDKPHKFLNRSPYYFLGYITRYFRSVSPLFKITFQSYINEKNEKRIVLFILPQCEDRQWQKTDIESALQLFIKFAEKYNMTNQTAVLSNDTVEELFLLRQNLTRCNSAIAAQMPLINDFSLDNRLHFTEHELDVRSFDKFKTYTNINWTEYFKGLISVKKYKQLIKSKKHIALISNLFDVNPLINPSFNVTKTGTLINYMFLKIFFNLVQNLKTYQLSEKMNINKCVIDIGNNFRSAVGRMIFDH